MILDYDCARDILVWIRNNQYQDEEEIQIVRLKHLYDALPQYPQPDIYYAVKQLLADEYLEGEMTFLPNGGRVRSCKIVDVTPKGHTFVENTKSKTVWEATKEKAKQLGGVSFGLLGTFAGDIIQGLAQNPEVIQNVTANIKL